MKQFDYCFSSFTRHSKSFTYSTHAHCFHAYPGWNNSSSSGVQYIPQRHINVWASGTGGTTNLLIHGPDLTCLHHFTLETFQTKQSTHPDDSLTKLLQPSSCAERTRKPNIPFLLHFNGYQGTLGIIVKFYWSALAALFSLEGPNNITWFHCCNKTVI